MNILLNDRIVPKGSYSIDIEDRGYQFGDGIYEVVSFYNGVLFEWDAHLKRFLRSARELMITIPVDLESLHQNLNVLIKESGFANGYVYFQLTRGAAPRKHQFPENSKAVLIAYVLDEMKQADSLAHGVTAITAEDIRWQRVDIKSLNLLGNVMAKQKAVEAGAHEAILVRDGWVTEGSSTNVFAIRGSQCFTHPADNLILNGVTRQAVFRLMEGTDLQLREAPFTRTELLEMDEVFITSTTIEVCPVVEIDGSKIGDGKPGKYACWLRSAFQSLIFSVK